MADDNGARPHYRVPEIDWSQKLSAEGINEALSLGRGTPSDDPVISEVRALRMAKRNQGITTKASVAGQNFGRSATDLTFATGRPRDPMFYWRNNNLPYDVNQPGELARVREFCRILYMTHPIIGSCVDIYSKFPLTGMELSCKDDALTKFYETLFFDELDYEEFLIDIGREYWSTGEAWPFGTFNELLGVWENEELLRPEDITVIKSPFMKDPRFEMRLPSTLREILQKREPRPEYERLTREYPELIQFISDERNIPVSGVLLKQIMFKADTFHPRGIPIWLRGFRTIIQEEMLNAAQDAVADRLYTPLILARLGASASDLGTDQPWIPTTTDMLDFEDALDAALAADFRVIVHHFALQMDTVFGREAMPDFSGDFSRIDDRILQVVGLSKTMLNGADQGETYAADALNRDLITQLLTTYQRKLQKHFKARALIVAEAQEHFDYEERAGKRYPIMEEVLERDEETGEDRIVEQPKLLVPDLNFSAMNMQDDTVYRQMIEALVVAGMPISQRTRLVNIPIELDDEVEAIHDEQVNQAVEAQMIRKDTYKALRDAGLPIPEDLQADFGATAMAPVAPAAPEQPFATPGNSEPASTQALTPGALSDDSDPALSGEDPGGQDQAPTDDSDPAAQGAPGTVATLPRNKLKQRQRPEESDEMRAGMPRASSLTRGASNGAERPSEPPQRLQDPWSVGKRRLAGLVAGTPLDAPEGLSDDEVIVLD